MAGKFSVQGVFKMSDGMTRPIARMEGRIERMMRKVNGYTNALGSGMLRGFSAAGAGLKALGERAREPLAALGGELKTLGAAGVAAGVAAAGGLVEVMRTGMNFEKALLSAGNKFEAGISKDSETFKQLSAVAQKVGGTTEFSATQAANGLKELAGAGLDAGQAMAALPGTVNLATAAEMEDMAAATEIAVKSLGAFGLKSKDPLELAKNLERVSDVLVKTDDISSTSVPAFFEAIAEGGAVAKTAGADLETYGALVAGLSDIEQGSNAGTTLKNMFLTLSKPTKEGADAFQKFGIKTTDAMGNTRDAIDVLAELNAATAKLGTGDKAGVLEQIFGKIPLAGVMTLMDKIDEVSGNRGKLRTEAGGSVNKKAASMRSGGTGTWDNFTSGLEAVSLAIFEVVGGPMNALITSTTEWIAEVKDAAIPYVKQFTSSLSAGFKEAWPAVKGALDMLGGFTGGKQLLNTVGYLAGWLGKLVAVAIGAAAIFARLAAVLGGLVAVQIRVVTAVITGLGKAFGWAAFAVSDFFANLAAKWDAFDFGDWAKRMIDGLVQGIRNGASFVLDAIKELADKMVNKLRDALKIHSPSKRTAELGRFAAMGVGEGWETQMPKVDQQIERTLDVSSLVRPLPLLDAPAMRWAMPAVNALPLGYDGPPAPAPELQMGPEGGRGSGAARRDELEVTVRAADGAAAEITKKPKSKLITLKVPNSGGGAP